MIIMQPDLRHLPRIMGQMLCKQALTHHVQLFYEFSIIIPIFTDEAPGSQASPRWEAKDSALLPSRDADILVPPEWPQGSPASSSLFREDS